MCPSSVHKVTKMRNSSNMVLLTFFGSTLSDRVHIGPINLRVRRFVSRPLQCFSCYWYDRGKRSCKEASRCGNCSALGSYSEEHFDAVSYCFHCHNAHQVRSRQCPRYCLQQDILQLANSQFISLGSACHELLSRQKDGTGATSYASLAARSSAESAGSDQVAPRLCGVDRLAQAKQPKISPGAHDHESFKDRSAMAAPIISVEPAVTPSVSDLAFCDEGALEMESSDDVVTAVPRGPTVAKSAVRSDPRPPVPGRNGDNSHHSPVGRKAAVHRPGTSQLPVSSCWLIIPSQWNCRGLRASWGELWALLSEFSPTCVALQETMLGDNIYSSPPGYRALFSTPFHEQGHHGGTAILLADFDTCSEAVDYFTDFLRSAALETVPRMSHRFTKRPVPGWNAAYTNAVKEKRAAFSRLR
ncbi:hypothetical protein E2C01_062812 [Portunus trituberculatus]|uniref:Endonuclease/exonuclease/phosphatase domain-containing protein n=1 Tax=Portunus trituberculatus TaxID=210409 RepID=A0A5B7H8X7_PORTR|nr:hypothetical protein [Portunus trituberculatus]